MRKIKLKQTHRYDFIQGYEYVQAKTGYYNKLKYVYSDHNIRVVYKDDNNIQYSLFETIKNLINLEWFDNELVESLETNYYLLQSGEKNISTLFYNLLTFYNSQDLNDDYINVNEEVYIKLAMVIISRFKNNWNNVYNTYVKLSYNPLETYNINETIKENYKLTKNNTNNENIISDINRNGENVENRDIIDNENNNYNNTNTKNNYSIERKNYVYNGNSVLPNENIIENGTITDNGEDNTDKTTNIKGKTTNTIIENNTKTKTNINEESTTRNADDNYITREKNGIFNTPKQTLIEKELNLRKFDFMLQIMRDIDKILVSQIY